MRRLRRIVIVLAVAATAGRESAAGEPDAAGLAAQIDRHIDDANTAWIARSAIAWTLDLSMLTDAGITLRRPEQAEDRPAAADRALQEARRADVPALRIEPEPPRVEPPVPALLPRRGWLSRLAGR